MKIDLMSLKEFGEIVKRPESTLRQWRHRGFGPASFRVGGLVMYRRDEVERWLNEQERADARGGDAA